MRKQVQMRINTNGRYSKYGMHSSITCRREVHMKEKDSVIDNVKSADSRKTSDKKIISDNKTMSATGKPSAGENRENKMGVMSEGKLLMSMSLPMIISMLFQAMYNVVDSVFVSRFSMDGLTAVSTAFPIQNLMIGVFSGLGVGFNAFISKALGEKKFDRANEVARQGIFLEAIGYVIFLIIGLFFARTFMVSQTGDAQVIQYGTEYLEVCCCCAFGIAFQMTFERLLQSTGRTMYSMITQILGAVINLILDPIMIFGLLGCPRMGVKGAAIATVCGQCIAGTLAMIFNIKKNPDLHITLRKFRPHGEIIGKILGVGVPSVIMVAIGSVMNYFLNLILFSFSKLAVAVFGAYFKVQSMAFMPVFGLNNGMIPIISYNYGAQRPDRMKRTMKLGVMVGCSIMLFCLVIMQAFPGQILKIFDATDDMLSMGIPAVRIMSTAFIFAGFSVTCSGMFQAVGKGVYSMIVSMARQLFVILPVAYFLSKAMNSVNGVWTAFPIAEIFSVIISTFLLLRVYKKIVKPLERGQIE